MKQLKNETKQIIMIHLQKKLLVFFFFAGLLIAQHSIAQKTIPAAQIAKKEINVTRAIPPAINQNQITIDYRQLDISTLTVVDANNNTIDLTIQKKLSSSLPSNMIYNEATVFVEKLSKGVYYLKGKLSGTPIYYKLTIN